MAEQSPLEEAIAVVGGQSELARQINKTQGHISAWLRRGKVPAECVLDIETVSGISRHKLRPDVFGLAPAKERAA